MTLSQRSSFNLAPYKGDVSVQQLLFSAKYQLAVVAENPLFEAEILLGHVLKKPRSYLYAWSNNKLNSLEVNKFFEFVSRRLNNEPIAYITGSKEFWSLDLLVSKDTLIPRPETELLVEIALDIFASALKLNSADPGGEFTQDAKEGMPSKSEFNSGSHVKVADLGTGCGAIALALAHEKPDWQIFATDIEEKALQIAKKNAQRLSIPNVAFYQGHWCAALPDVDFDMIISNPPYISESEWEEYTEGTAFEPTRALISGLNGLDDIKTIIFSSKNYLKSNGYLIIEHGFLQGSAVRKLFALAEYSQIRSIRDLSGQERVTLGRIC